MTRQRMAGVFIVLFGGAMAFFGGQLLLSALNAEQAQRFLDHWAIGGQPPSAEAFAVAEIASIRAIRLYPGASGEHWDRLGRVYDWRHWRAPFGRAAVPSTRPPVQHILEQPLGAAASADPAATRLRAISAYEKAVSLRPLWPYGVTRLAFARLRAGAPDQALAELLKTAYRLGPWRPTVNRRITEIGLLGWAGLDQQARDIVLENARRTTYFSRADERWVRQLGEQTDLDLLLSLLVLP